MNNYINIFFMLITSITGVLISLNNISPYKLNKKDNIIIVLSIMLSYFLLSITIPNFATIAIYFIPIFFIYRKSKRIFTSIIIEICACIIIMIVDNFISAISYFIFGDNYNTNNMQYWITCFVILLVLYFVTKIIGKIGAKYKDFFYENFKSKYFIMIYVMILFTFATFYFVVNWSKHLSTKSALKVNAIIVLIYGIAMMVICISLFFMVKKEEKYKYEQVELENLKEYTINLENLYTEMRKFRHDYINVISSISAFIEERDVNGLEQYFNTNICPLNNTMSKNNYKLGLLKNIKLQEVKGLIAAKVIRAQEIGLDVVIDIVEEIDRIEMDKIDLIRALGIILDNAIEASIESCDKKVNIALVRKNESVIIVITNTYEDNILPIGKMFKLGVSTKGENRGLGLSNLKEIVNKYNNVSLDTYINNNEFVQEISIYNK